ncbi:MAG TPA: hypothetical protein VK624_15340 [Steroidobacteraceae bacterium]|nr:hypothetical protein [Steroidobacteraceae bacterium]
MTISRAAVRKCLPVMLMVSFAANADCDPKGVFRIVTVNMSPDIPKDSFAAKPKVAYRSGKYLARLEEAPDPANGMHLLFVINAPDAWTVNLLDKTGDHMVDKAESKDVHMLVFDPDPALGIPDEFSAIEFACEREFFASHDAVLVPLKSERRAMTKHQVSKGEWRITMITEVGSDIPWALMLAKSDRVISAIRYISYLSRPDIDAALFAKPEGIKFVEH